MALFYSHPIVGYPGLYQCAQRYKHNQDKHKSGLELKDYNLVRVLPLPLEQRQA